ncbi:MAG TPA: MFS transporter, partial [Thermomicrobiales bacterium]|nr:MFS transporter [Thermomicrobiales bacterium]
AGCIVTGVVPLLVAFSFGGSQYAWSSPQIVGLLSIAIAGIVAFLFVESRSSNPIIPLSLFSNRIFSISVMASAIMGVAMFGTILYVPLYMQGVLGASATTSGVVLTPMMLSMVVASIIGGQLISRTGRYKWAVISGLLSMQIGMLLLSRMGVNTTDGEVVRNMIVTGVGLGLVMPTITLAVQNAFPARQLGVTTSSLQFFRQIGGTIGIALMGTFLTSRLQANVTRDVPAETLNTIPQPVIDNLDPQALANPDAQAELEAALTGIENAPQLLDSLLSGLRSVLAEGLQDVFLIAAAVTLLAVVMGFFIPELELQKGREDAKTPISRTISTPATGESNVTRAQVAND